MGFLFSLKWWLCWPFCLLCEHVVTESYGCGRTFQIGECYFRKEAALHDFHLTLSLSAADCQWHAVELEQEAKAFLPTLAYSMHMDEQVSDS